MGYGEYYNTTIPVGGHISWYWPLTSPWVSEVSSEAFSK